MRRRRPRWPAGHASRLPSLQRSALLLWAGLIAMGLTSCSGEVLGGETAEIPAFELAVEVQVPLPVVEYGAPFPLQLERIHSKDIELSDLAQDALAPLVLKERRIEREENATHVRERVLYDAFCFELGPVLVPPLTLRGLRAEGGELEAVSEALHLDVQSALGERTVQVAEALEPFDPPEARPFNWLWTLLLLPLGLGYLLLRRFVAARRVAGAAPESETIEVPREDPRVVVGRRIVELESYAVADREADRAFHIEAAAVVRDYAGAVLGIGSPEETSSEWLDDLAHAGILDAALQGRLRAMLRVCDYVKFANARSDDAGRAKTLETIRELLGSAGADAAEELR
jgi:hypothetical protein